MKTQDTVYSILAYIDQHPLWVQRVKRVEVYFFDNEKTTESIEFNKKEDISSWSKSIEESIKDNEFLQALFRYGKILDSNLGAIKLNLASYLEITVTAPFIADGLQELQNTSDKEDTNMDNQQLSEGKIENPMVDAILQCDQAFDVDQLKRFLDNIDGGVKVFLSNGKGTIYPLSTVIIAKIGNDEIEESVLSILLGSLDKDLTLESSTTSE